VRFSGSSANAYSVPPLEVPAEEPSAADQILDHSAPELFIVRARELGADLSSHADSLSSVAAICRRLDGIPLAIEFAAARAATLGVDRVAAELRDHFATLASGRRMVLPRHRTLCATLDSSYRLLSDRERQVLRRLSVFAGRFTLEAATSVTSLGEASDDDIADDTASLIAKSLVTSDIAKGGGCFRLLEMTRLYASTKLHESRELQEFCQRHADYYRSLLEGMQQDQSPETLGAQLDNVCAALEWCFGSTGNPVMGVRLAAAARPLFVAMSLLNECRHWSQQALSALNDAGRAGCKRNGAAVFQSQ
jgi:predicted ATPase